MDILSLFTNVSILVLMLVPGYLLARFGLSTDGLAKGLSNLVLYAAQPALIIAGFVDTDFSPAILLDMVVIFCLSGVIHLIFTAVGYFVYRKAPDRRRQVLWFATVFTNAGYMGIPLLCALLGSGAAIYASVYIAAFNVCIWSIGGFIYTGDRSYISVRKMLFNPASVSIAVGLALFALSAIPAVREGLILPYIRNKDSIFGGLMNGIKALVAPLAMIVIGLRLAEVKLGKIFRDKWLYVYLVVAMFVCPVLSYAVAKFSGLFYPSEMIHHVMLISAAAPAATATSMFAEKLDGDVHYSGVLVSVSSILCVITMPIVSLLPY